MTFFAEFLCVIITLFIAWIVLSGVRPRKYPSGPFIFPVIGNFPQMIFYSRVLKLSQVKLYDSYRKAYGKIYSIQLGRFPVVVLTCPKLIREAWNNPSIQGRPKLHGAAARTKGTIRGIIFQDGPEWSEQRRFALRHLKDFGFGKRTMESLIMDEVNELLESFSKDAGSPINTQTRFNVAVLNSFWSIVAGRRYSHDDPLLSNIVENIHKSFVSRGFVFFFPWLKDWFPKWSGWEAYIACLPLPYNFIDDFVRERLTQHSDDLQEPEHFTDAFLNEIKRTKDESSSFFGKRGEETLVATLLDLFVAGIETTSSTLSYTLLYLAMYPEAQEKVHQEITNATGKNTVTLGDRKLLPYVDATILEVLRFSSAVPTGLVHKTTSQVTIGHHVIPENVWVIANLHGVHHDPDIWGDPENFRPERFLDEDGKVIRSHEALLPFSAGKRVCLGESLARDELFLFIANIFQKFSVKGEEGVELTSEQLNSEVIAMPKPHRLVLTKR